VSLVSPVRPLCGECFARAGAGVDEPELRDPQMQRYVSDAAGVTAETEND